MNGRTVRGQIVLPDTGVPDRAREVVVRIEDVSRADAPSLVVGEQRLRDVALAPGASIPFAVEVPAGRIDPRSLYSASAHLDVPGTGGVKVGDLLSTQSYPVLTRGYPDTVSVRVQKI